MIDSSPTNRIAVRFRLTGKVANHSQIVSERDAFYAFSSRNVSSCSSLAVSCNRTVLWDGESHVCRCKGKFSTPNYYCETLGSGFDGYFQVFGRKIDADDPKQYCGLTNVWTLTGYGYCGTLLWFGPVCWWDWRSPVDWRVGSKWQRDEFIAPNMQFTVFMSVTTFLVPTFAHVIGTSCWRYKLMLAFGFVRTAVYRRGRHPTPPASVSSRAHSQLFHRLLFWLLWSLNLNLSSFALWLFNL